MMMISMSRVVQEVSSSCSVKHKLIPAPGETTIVAGHVLCARIGWSIKNLCCTKGEICNKGKAGMA